MLFDNFRGTQREHVVRHMVTVHKVQPERNSKTRKRKGGAAAATATSTEEMDKEHDVAAKIITIDEEITEENDSEQTTIDAGESQSTEAKDQSDEKKASELDKSTVNEKQSQDEVPRKKGENPEDSKSSNTEKEILEASSDGLDKKAYESGMNALTEIAIKVLVKQESDVTVQSKNQVYGEGKAQYIPFHKNFA